MLLSPAPPLTVKNIFKAVEGVNDWELLAKWLSVYYGSSFKDAVEQFLQGQSHYQPSWRAVIFSLDGAGETHLANCIRSYGEPIQGRYTHTHTATQKYKLHRQTTFIV